MLAAPRTRLASPLAGVETLSLCPCPLSCVASVIVLTVGGLLNGLAVGTILGAPPTIKSYKGVFVFAANGAIALTVAVGWLIIMYFDPYFFFTYLDPLASDIYFSYLGDDNYLKPLL